MPREEGPSAFPDKTHRPPSNVCPRLQPREAGGALDGGAAVPSRCTSFWETSGRRAHLLAERPFLSVASPLASDV